MTYVEAVRRLVDGMRADASDYERLRELLDLQFHAALRHSTEDLSDLATRITALTEVLDGRRRERLALARLLVGGRPQPGRSKTVSIEAVAARMPAATRVTFETEWSALESRVRECKQLNTRNCRLLMGQFEIMQRLMATDVHTYAPA